MHQESELPASVKAHDPPRQKRRSPGAGNAEAHEDLHSGAKPTTVAALRQAGLRRPRLSRADRENLRRLTALAHHVVDLRVDAAGLKEPRRAAYTRAAELGAWHRRVEPTLYGREAGGRP